MIPLRPFKFLKRIKTQLQEIQPVDIFVAKYRDVASPVLGRLHWMISTVHWCYDFFSKKHIALTSEKNRCEAMPLHVFQLKLLMSKKMENKVSSLQRWYRMVPQRQVDNMHFRIGHIEKTWILLNNIPCRSAEIHASRVWFLVLTFVLLASVFTSSTTDHSLWCEGSHVLRQQADKTFTSDNDLGTPDKQLPRKCRTHTRKFWYHLVQSKFMKHKKKIIIILIMLNQRTPLTIANKPWVILKNHKLHFVTNTLLPISSTSGHLLRRCIALQEGCCNGTNSKNFGQNNNNQLYNSALWSKTVSMWGIWKFFHTV